jgi:magnesium transporter
MADKKLSLALGFISAEPVAAARILEHSHVADVARFLPSIPLDYQQTVLKHLLPGYAARLCVQLGNKQAVAILSGLDATDIARIVRLMPRDPAADILGMLPKKRREASTLLMKYSVRFVGAWMQPYTHAVSTEMSVAEVLHYMRQEVEGHISEYIYIIDRNGKLAGRLSYFKLLTSNHTIRMSNVMERDIPQAPINMLLENALELPQWGATDTLAVVDKNSRLIGLIRHADIRNALAQSTDQHYTQSNDTDLVTGLSGVYGKTLLVLFNNLLNVIEPDLKS